MQPEGLELLLPYTPYSKVKLVRTLIEHSEHTPTAVENPGRLAVKRERRMRKVAWGMRVVLLCLLFVVTLWGLTPHLAQAASGLYLSSELGANFSPNLEMTGTSNDRASVCDEFINPLFATVTQTAGYENYNCTGPNRGATGDWENAFDGGEGVLAGAAIGYSLWDKYPDRVWGRVRLELEYFYRDTDYDQTADIPSAAGESGDKLTQEILTATDRVGSVTSHNLFGNLYFDFPNNSQLIPYVGFGVGVGFTDMDYGSLWARNPDPNAITTGAGLPNVDAIRRNLAGTVSSEQTNLSDTLFGYQVLFGVDYALTEALTLGVKGRWVNFDAFSEGSIVWDPLRSHPPNLRRDLSEPVSGSIKIRDIEIFGVSVTMKYHF